MADHVPTHPTTLVEVTQETLRELEDIRAIMARVLTDRHPRFDAEQQRGMIIGIAVLIMWRGFEQFMPHVSAASAEKLERLRPLLNDLAHLLAGR